MSRPTVVKVLVTSDIAGAVRDNEAFAALVNDGWTVGAWLTEQIIDAETGTVSASELVFVMLPPREAPPRANRPELAIALAGISVAALIVLLVGLSSGVVGLVLLAAAVWAA